MRKKSARTRHDSSRVAPEKTPGSSLSAGGKRRVRKVVLWTLAAALLGSFVFFDSHSLLKRMKWRSDYARVREENEKLRAENAELEQEIREGLSDEVVEKIAREEYGMRRPGETVYAVATPDDGEDPDVPQRIAMPEYPDTSLDGQTAERSDEQSAAND